MNSAINRPIVVPETAYPSTKDFTGQFSRWKKETPGYPLTPEGQKRWLSDFIAFCEQHPAIDSVYYWSPEWYGEGMWKGFAFFDISGNAKPAWTAFATPPQEHPTPKKSLYFELTDESLEPVPIDEAKSKAEVALREELKRFGQVNTNYIQAITARDLKVGGYRVNLRASLMGNLDLFLSEKTSKTDWQEVLSNLDTKKERVILFNRNPNNPLVEEIRAFAAKNNIEVLEHPLSADAPLKFSYKLIQNDQSAIY